MIKKLKIVKTKGNKKGSQYVERFEMIDFIVYSIFSAMDKLKYHKEKNSCKNYIKKLIK